MHHVPQLVLICCCRTRLKGDWAHLTPRRLSKYARHLHPSDPHAQRAGFNGTNICDTATGSVRACLVREHFMDFSQGYPGIMDVASNPKISMMDHAQYKFLVSGWGSLGAGNAARRSGHGRTTLCCCVACGVRRRCTWTARASAPGALPSVGADPAVWERAHEVGDDVVQPRARFAACRLDQLLPLGSTIFKEESGYYGFYHHLLKWVSLAVHRSLVSIARDAWDPTQGARERLAWRSAPPVVLPCWALVAPPVHRPYVHYVPFWKKVGATRRPRTQLCAGRPRPHTRTCWWSPPHAPAGARGDCGRAHVGPAARRRGRTHRPAGAEPGRQVPVTRRPRLLLVQVSATTSAACCALACAASGCLHALAPLLLCQLKPGARRLLKEYSKLMAYVPSKAVGQQYFRYNLHVAEYLETEAVAWEAGGQLQRYPFAP